MATASPYTWDIFLAHAGPDTEQAENLYDLLYQKCRVFLDSKCLDLGDNWDSKLPEAQNESFMTVVLVSANTQKAYYQREEIAAAIDLARHEEERYRVVPIYLGPTPGVKKQVPYGLRLKHGLELSSGITLAQCADRLLETLRKTQVGTEPQAPPIPGASKHDQRGILLQPPAQWVSPILKNQWRYKMVAFDFDGTLLRGKDFDFSWEAVWKGLGFAADIQKRLKREYRQKSEADPSRAGRVAAYEAWCKKACDYFTRRNLTRSQLKEFASKLTLTNNCRDAMQQLRDDGFALAIISGGINTFLEDVFPDYRDYLDFVFINEFTFDGAEKLTGVHITSYDFQGKAEALDVISERVGCTVDETIFVGDHFNDEAVMVKVDKAIAYPPRDLVAKDAAQVPVDEDNLLAILPHVFVP